MKRVWSKNQLEVINSNDSTILVSASAGSGKTTVMIERILRLMADGVKISNMLICTFTKASAADMRSKLYQEMSKRGLKSELKDLSNADISTIDSFCQRIVTKYFYVLGVDPQFEMLDEGESKALKNQAAEQSIAYFLNDKNFATFAEILRKRRKNNTLKKAILAIMDFRSINPDNQPSYDYNQDEVADKLNCYVQELKDDTLKAIEQLFAEIDEKELYAELLSAMQSGNAQFEKNRKYKKENDHFKPCFKYIKERVKECINTQNVISELKSQSLSGDYIVALLSAADYACKAYEAEKQKRSALDFADLENMTLKILQSDAIYEIRRKYKYVFVDEYQDINPLQESLIQLVSKGNNLFMVGDIKQSIYAFRGCDPGIFKSKYDRFSCGEGGKLISLDTNYRSNKSIIDFVNKVFGLVMTNDFGGIDYAANPMIAASESEGYVMFNIIKGGESSNASGVYSVKNHQDNNINKTEAEATLVAYRVQELLKKEVDSRPVSFGDIAILTRSMGKLERLVIKRLSEINVPVSLTEDAYYLDRPETGQLINYLRLIDNRLDDNAMALAMLSPFGGFDENELALIRLGGDGEFYECVSKAAKHNGKVREFFDKLDRYYEISLTAPVDELADVIVSENGYFNYAYRLGEDAAEVLDKFLEFLGGCPAKNSLKGTIRFIDEHNPYANLSSDDNSVKLMTIHKSKGLQFKFVFVIGLGEKFNMQDLYKPVMVGSKVAMQVFENHEAFDSDLRYLSTIALSKKQLEEELRILYVALTRAEEGLELFAGVSQKDEKSEAISIMPSIADFSRCLSPIKWLAPQMYQGKLYSASKIQVEKAPTTKVLFAKADEEQVKLLKAYFDFLPQKNAPAKSYVSKLAHNDDEESAVIIVPEEGVGDALERGNAYHRAMESIDFFSPSLDCVDKDDLKLIDADKLLVAAKKMSVFDGTFYKEKPFMIKLSASDVGVEGSGEMLVQGVVDLLIVKDEQAIVIDYKTGRIHGPFEEGYFRQVNLYAMAVEKLLKIKVVGKYLYYFDAKEFVEIK